MDADQWSPLHTLMDRSRSLFPFVCDSSNRIHCTKTYSKTYAYCICIVIIALVYRRYANVFFFFSFSLCSLHSFAQQLDSNSFQGISNKTAYWGKGTWSQGRSDLVVRWFVCMHRERLHGVTKPRIKQSSGG